MSIKYEVIKNVVKIPTKYDQIQINLMKWENNKPKYDIRKWSNNDVPAKGFTLSEEELLELYHGLKTYYGEDVSDDGNDEQSDLTEDVDDNYVNEIDFRKFLVYTDKNSCERNGHDYEEVDACVYVLTSWGEVRKRIVKGYYCNNCKAYYISRNTFFKLDQEGKVMCHVFTPDTFEEYKKESKYGNGLRPESLLHIAGYNVGQADNLSEKQRHIIIEYVIESEVMQKEEVDYLLSKFIERGEFQRNMELAVSRWRADRDWLRGYTSTGKRLVGIKYIIDKS